MTKSNADSDNHDALPVKRAMRRPAVSYGPTYLAKIHQCILDLGTELSGLLAFTLGAISVLSFAPFHLTPILIISFTGLVWLLDSGADKPNWGRSMFYRLWAFGVGYVLAAMHWTAAPFLVQPEQHIWFIWLPLIVLPVGMSLIWGIFGIIAGHFWSFSPSRIFIFTIAFSLAECVRGNLFGGFPWNLAGTSWVPGGAMSQLAALGGVYWLTLLTVFLASAPAALTDLRAKKSDEWRVFPLVLAIGFLVSGFIWGYLRTIEPASFRPISVTAMDAGIPPSERISENATPLKEHYFEMMRHPDAQSDIIIWPEAALIRPILQESDTLADIAIRLQDRVLITGTVHVQPLPQQKYRFFNSLLVIDESGRRSEFLARYDKFRLVPFGEIAATRIFPFGEYFANFLPASLSQMASQGFTPGEAPQIVYTAESRVPPFVPMICYEALFPEIARRAQLEVRADWLVNISADGWFGGWLGPAQHYAQNRYRAIESGLPLVRAANRGKLAILDGKGRETDSKITYLESEMGWQSTLVRYYLAEPEADTLYISLGMACFWLTIFVFSIFTFITWRR